MLQFMPALAAEVEVNAISGMDPTRHDSHNDFFDRELLIYALAYSGTFAAIDKWLASLVSHSRRDGFPAFYAYADSLAEDRKSAVEGKSVTVSVAIVGRR